MTMLSPLARTTIPFPAYGPEEAEDDPGQLMVDDYIAADASMIQQAFENSHDCIALVDLQGVVMYMNLPGSCLMGLDARPPQQPVSWLELWSPDNHDLAEYSIDEAKSGHQCRFMACRRTATGLPRWWDIAANPVFDTHGRPSQMFCVCRDVTEFKQTERSLQLEVAAKELLLVEANHRVKNHLAGIAGALALQARACRNETVRASLQQAQSRIQAVALIHRRLQHSQTHDQLELSPCITDIAREAVKALGVEDHIAVSISCPKGLTLPTARAVPVLLMTTELITNCLKHAYPDRTRGSVHVTFGATQRHLLVQVDDDGPGLPLDYEVHARGIGMIIVKGLIAQLSGDLQIDPQPKGAHFRVRLPKL